MYKSALLIGIIDSSGSMGSFERYLSEKVFNDIKFILDAKYMSVKTKGIKHHTEANVVDISEMFQGGVSGGTIVSRAYNLLESMIDIVDESATDIYVIQFSDGDNLTSDNEKTVECINRLSRKCTFIGYVEINQYNRHSTLIREYKKIELNNFRTTVLKGKLDCVHVASTFLRV